MQTAPDRIHPNETTGRPPRTLRHISSASQDTNVSGFADSTISNGESLRLSQFPNPPASIPTTPILSEFGTPSPVRSAFNLRTAPLIPKRRGPLPTVSSRGTTPHNLAREFSPAPSTPHSLSPYDWHDGASSIGVDATEDRLLSTSFITSLLQENASRARRVSYGSDALSGFSEMTYPPLASSFSSDSGYSPYSPSSTRTYPQKPVGSRPPPSAFTSIPEKHSSGDSDTLYSSRDHNPSVLRTASISRGLQIQGASVVGVMPATLHNISASKNVDTDWHHDSDEISQSKDTDTSAAFSSTSTSAMLPREGTRNPRNRESVQSTTSAVPSLISFISSNRSVRRVLAWRRTKPLPPVPLISNIPIAVEIENRRADESRPLPDLVHRAGALQGLLEKGYHPHQSLHSYYAQKGGGPMGHGLVSAFDDADTIDRHTNPVDTPSIPRGPKPVRKFIGEWPSLSLSSIHNSKPKQKKRIYIILGVFLVVALAAVGTAVGITLGRKKNQLPICNGNLVGASCNLNATCVCTSSTPGRCDGLAQNVLDLVPEVNRVFKMNLTSSLVYNNIWLAQGAVPGSNCASQARLVDVEPALDANTLSTFYLWAQTALLWNLVESQSLEDVAKLQKFVQQAPWAHLDNSPNVPELFSTTVSGYTFNFATREVTEPKISFVTNGQPTNAQLTQVGPIAQNALDLMYGFATASSTQRQNALEIYWTTVLHQRLLDLPTFISAFSVSPILLPFDAGSQPVSSLLTTSDSSPFPPPLGCYPGLTPDKISKINAVETGIFGLSPISNRSQFDASCFPDRPIYGVLDVLRLRLPFLDKSGNSARQAAVLLHDVSPRALMRSGETVSQFLGSENATTVGNLDSRNYGTFSQFNHVVLDYLVSMPDVKVAIALVEYVLASASTLASPPTNTSILYQSIAAIPIMEVIVFGSITPADISTSISAFTTSSGSLFFGSDQGNALRNWAITGSHQSIVWSELALSPLVVRDSDLSEPIFNQTWNAASIALEHGIKSFGLQTVIDTFQRTRRFTT